MGNMKKNNTAIALKEFFGQFSLASLKSSPMVRNISLVYFGDIFARIIGISTSLLIVRGLSVPDFAAYTAFLTVTFLVPKLVGGGMNAALVRFSADHISRTGKKPVELYFINLVTQVLLYALLGVLLLLFRNEITSLLFGKLDFGPVLFLGILAGLGLLITEAGRGIFKAEENFKKFIRTVWLRQILFFAAILVLMITKNLNFIRTAQSVILAEAIVAFIITFYIYRYVKINHVLDAVKNNFGKYHEFVYASFWLILYVIIRTCFSRLDIFMLSHFSVKEELANYGLAFRFYSYGLLLLTSINSVLLPKFSKADMQKTSNQKAFFYKWFKAIGWSIILIVLADLFCKPLFLKIVGTEYDHAYSILVVFSFGVWLSLMLSPLVNILISRKAYKTLIWLALGAFVINFSGNYFLIPIWGGMGAALITVVSHAFINIIATIKVFQAVSDK